MSTRTEFGTDQTSAPSAGLKLGIAYSVERWREGDMDFFVRDTDQMWSMGLGQEAARALLDDEFDGEVTAYGCTANVINGALIITRFHTTLPIVGK